jgi:hypothetical protein
MAVSFPPPIPESDVGASSAATVSLPPTAESDRRADDEQANSKRIGAARVHDRKRVTSILD